MPLDREHVVLLPSVHSIFQVGLQGVVYSIGHVLDLPLTAYLDHLDVQSSESLNKPFQGTHVGLPLSLESLLFRSNLVLQFRELLFLLGRPVELLASLQGSSSSLL